MEDKRIINFVTSNSGKVKSLQEHIGDRVIVRQVQLDLIEPQLGSPELISCSKAEQAFTLLKQPVITDDSSFCIDALNGFPGPYAKYVISTIGPEGLIQLAKPLKDRSCHFSSALSYIDEVGELHSFVDEGPTGRLALKVAPDISGQSWSGLWRIFIPPGTSKALSALSGAERVRTWDQWKAKSAFTQFADWLDQQYKGR